MTDNLIVKENGAGVDSESKENVTPVQLDLNTMIKWVSKVYLMGFNEYHTKAAIAKEFDITADSVKPYLSMGQQYRLLEIKHGTGYKATLLFREIHLPDNTSKKDASAIDSLKSPKIFSNLFREYENHILPDIEGLTNKLIKNYNYKKPVAERVARAFYNNIKDYDLLGERNILYGSQSKIKKETKPLVNPSDDTGGIKPPAGDKNDNGTPDATEVIKLEIKLKDKRFANLIFPKDYDDIDLHKMYGVIVAYLNAYSESGDVATNNKGG
jgi:hypothetical protein